MESLPIHRCLSAREWAGVAVPVLALGPVSPFWSLGAGVSLGLAAAWLIRRRRGDRAFVARQLELVTEVHEIQDLQRQALEDLASCRKRSDLGVRCRSNRAMARWLVLEPAAEGHERETVLESLPRKLEELAIRSFDFGVALKKLDSLPPEKEIAREIRSVDRRIQKCRSEAQKSSWLQARCHLVRELATIQKAREQRRQLECRLYALARFFRATRTEIRSMAARVAAQAGEADPTLTGEVHDIITAVNDLETTLEEIVEAPVLPELEARDPLEEPDLEPVQDIEPRMYRPR